jgi:putative heme-binding domain-containing protein
MTMHQFPDRRRSTKLLLLAAISTLGHADDALAQPATPVATAASPAVAWAAGPLDVVVAFDKPLDPSAATALVGKTISYFELAAAPAGRIGSPAPLGALRIVGARLDGGGRTLTLATDPHPALARYELPLPANTIQGRPSSSAAIPNYYTLNGVEAVWTEENSGEPQPTAGLWWPLLDLEATRNLTRGSERHAKALAVLTKPGHLGLATLVRLPKRAATVRIACSQPIEEASLGDSAAEVSPATTATATHVALLPVKSEGEPLFLSVTCRTGADRRPLTLTATYTDGEKKQHAISGEQLILPWAPLPAPTTGAPLVVPDLAGGDPARGQTLFHGEQARCAHCHTVRGKGGKVGPDLSDIGSKGRAEIYRAIAAPSASIAPAYLSYSVATRSGRVVVGVVRALGADAIEVTDTNAQASSIPRDDIDQIRPSANSIMPVGLTGALGESAVRDLIAFLAAGQP